MTYRTLLFIIALATAGTSVAKEISATEALQRLNSAANLPAAAKAPAAAQATNVTTFYTTDQKPALYLYTTGNQLMVLPADDRINPLLGYTDQPATGQMPPQLKWWLGEYARQIQYLQSQPECSANHVRCSEETTSDKAPIAPMLTTTWYQDAPYNLYCPILANSEGEMVQAPTGCVATALSQVLNYYKYPAQATGNVSYTDDQGNSYAMDLAEQAFDWDNMIDDYGSSYTDEQANAVAYLMKAVGYACHMEYTADESGALNSDALVAMITNFGFPSSALSLDRDQFTLSEWQDMIYANLSAAGPTFYVGSDMVGGHAFVCDGYSSDGFFHINWGWGGYYDGYFQMTALSPAGQGIGGNAGGYNFSQAAFFNLVPPGHATAQLPEFSPIELVYSLTAKKKDATHVSLSGYGLDDEYPILFLNSTYNDVTVLMGIKAENLSTGEITYQSCDDVLEDIPYTSGYESYTVPLSLTEGEYHVSLVTKDYSNEDDSAPWLPVRHSSNDCDYFYAAINQQGEIADVQSCWMKDPTFTNITLQTGIAWGAPFRYSYTITNEDAVERNFQFYPAIISKKNVVMALGTAVSHTMQPGESVDGTLTSSIVESFYNGNFTGEAQFGFITMDGDIITTIPVTITDINDFQLNATAFSLDGDTNNVDANNILFNLTVECTEGYFANPIYIFLTTEDYDILTSVQSGTVFLNKGESVSGSLSTPFPDAEVGETYKAILGYAITSHPQILSEFDFTVTTGYASLALTTADKSAIEVKADRQAGAVAVTAPADIAKIEAYSLNGRLIPANAELNGTAATVSFDRLPAGLSLLKVTLTNGQSTVAKITK
jgi:hypothetical protein